MYAKLIYNTAKIAQNATFALPSMVYYTSQLSNRLYSPKKFDLKNPQPADGLRQTNREEDKVHCEAQAERKDQQRNRIRDESERFNGKEGVVLLAYVKNTFQ